MKNEQPHHASKSAFRILTGGLLIVFIIVLYLQSLFSVSARDSWQNDDTATATETETVTSTSTATETATASPTATATATATASPTATSTATSTLTPTLTATVTGTPPTPTATGTITPNPVLYMVVSPSQARINELLTFTVSIRNDGTAPLTGAYLSDTFPSYLDVQNVTTTKGSVSTSTHAVQVSLTTIFPGETVVVVIPVRVNSSLTSTMTLQNIATLTASNLTARTTSVYYTIILTSVLPGTGELPVENNAIVDLTLMLSLMVAATATIGLLLVVLFLKRDGKRSSAAFLFIIIIVLAVMGVSCLPEGGADNSLSIREAPAESLPTPTRTLMPFMPAYKFITPEPYKPLPDYPIPTPVTQQTQESETPPDTSPIVRLVIPSLSVDAIVKYVPYSDATKTWLIDGLREEIAWLGNTSWPGLGSNTVLAGHITVRGLGDGPFRYLENVAPGEEIILYTEANKYTYQVREQVVVNETDMAVTLPTVNTQLTLITCTGWDDELDIYRFRRVVFSDLVKAEPITYQGSVR